MDRTHINIFAGTVAALLIILPALAFLIFI